MKKILNPAILLCFFSTASAQSSLNSISAWAYQLQNMDVNAIAADTTFGLIVTDYSYDGTDAMKLTPADVSTVKGSGKKHISYISIGEAEDYRSYWQSSWTSSPPAWLGAENPNWPGNYKVKYWDPAWRSIVFDYIDTIVAQGFDGAYLDIIDGWYYWQSQVPQAQQVSSADSLMIDLVLRIRAHVNTLTGNPNFILMPQNGEDLIFQPNISLVQSNQYLGAITALGIEDVFFIGADTMDNPYAPDTYRLGNLAQYRAHGKKVFNIEYLSQPAKMQQYKDSVRHYGFVPYSCSRSLNRLCEGISTGINEATRPAFSLFPNPVTRDQMEFTSGQRFAEGTNFFIEDMQGRRATIASPEEKQAGKHIIDIPADLSNGMYILVMQDQNEQSVSRFVLQR